MADNATGEHEADWHALARMLEYRRPHGSASERKFINRYVRPTGARPDAFGNYILRIGTSPRVMFSAHTDSVHRTGGKQRLVVDDGFVRLHRLEATSNCLGADNAAGVWLLLELIRARVPGLYIFHRLEESGGQGSAYIAKHTPEVVRGIEIAVAFDRYGTKSVITHQATGRTCSDTFARTLAHNLGERYEPDPYGVFTDTASYSDLVSECTNISVGFNDEHTRRESLNLVHLANLRDAVLRVDWEALPTFRDPAEYEPSDPWGSWQSRLYDDAGKEADDDDDQSWMPGRSQDEPGEEPDLAALSIVDLVKDRPAEIADILEACGYTPESLYNEIDAALGYTYRPGRRTYRN